MGFIEEDDVKTLVQDEKMVAEIVKALVEDPLVLRELANDVASELEDLIEDDMTFKKKLIAAAVATPEFKKRVIRSLIEEIAD